MIFLSWVRQNGMVHKQKRGVSHVKLTRVRRLILLQTWRTSLKPQEKQSIETEPDSFFFFFLIISIFPLGITKHPAGKLVSKKALAGRTLCPASALTPCNSEQRFLDKGLVWGRKKETYWNQLSKSPCGIWYIGTSDTSCFCNSLKTVAQE